MMGNSFPKFLLSASPLPTLMVVPSGIGCSIGGFAGDSMPSARLLAAASGCLITHPNVMNGAALYWHDSRIQYVEGYALDRFAAGEIGLSPVRKQKVGLLFDAGIEPELRQRHLQVSDGCRASLGLDIGPVVTTERPLQVNLHRGGNGISWGDIQHPDLLLRAGESLRDHGATAIAVVTRFPDEDEFEALEAYREGDGVDVLAGAEAVISHLLVSHLRMPCAHSPALTRLTLKATIDPRAAGEELGDTFLPCVLVGLSFAPDFVQLEHLVEPSTLKSAANTLTIKDVGAVIAPEGALGGATVLACLEQKIPLIAVSNPSLLNVNAELLGLNKGSKEEVGSEVFFASNYIEAAGLLTLLREGISLGSLSRPILPTIEIE